MRRWIAAGATAALMAGTTFAWMSAESVETLPPPSTEAASAEPLDPPAAPEPSPKDREAKRLARYDRDKDGAVSRAEYLRSRERAFAKLDTNGDGRLDFNEYAIKTWDKFTKADADGNNILSAKEFAATAVRRKSKAKPACPPTGEADET